MRGRPDDQAVGMLATFIFSPVFLETLSVICHIFLLLEIIIYRKILKLYPGKMTSCDNLTLKVGENIEFDYWSMEWYFI